MRSWGLRVGPNPIWLVLLVLLLLLFIYLQEGEIRAQAHIEGSLCEDTGEDDHLQAKDRSFREPNSALILNF